MKKFMSLVLILVMMFSFVPTSSAHLRAFLPDITEGHTRILVFKFTGLNNLVSKQGQMIHFRYNCSVTQFQFFWDQQPDQASKDALYQECLDSYGVHILHSLTNFNTNIRYDIVLAHVSKGEAPNQIVETPIGTFPNPMILNVNGLKVLGELMDIGFIDPRFNPGAVGSAELVNDIQEVADVFTNGNVAEARDLLRDLRKFHGVI